ncbi:putative phage abortive infection protein [Dendrosporobacter sp. 1207_IL3150]|uniref:putative phage abortive infection protein n=1 Tax=Dendrosporobacter sp. 1207_IL3150 TaxID=3084054 RepID=UPI002FDA7220
MRLSFENFLKTIAVLLVCIGCVTPIYLFRTFYSPNNYYYSQYPLTIEQLGQLGPIADWLSGTTVPIFTLASFVFLFLAYRVQQQELSITRKQLDDQNVSLSLQRVENTFFQLIQNQRDIISGIEYLDGQGVRHRGRQYFSIALGEFISMYNAFRGSSGMVQGQAFNPQADIEATVDAYLHFSISHQNNIGHYFRNLYHIVKFIDRSESLKDQQKKELCSLLRAQLSAHELALLFANVTFGPGYPKFMPLVKKYDLLQNLDKNILPFAIRNVDPILLDSVQSQREWKNI